MKSHPSVVGLAFRISPPYYPSPGHQLTPPHTSARRQRRTCSRCSSCVVNKPHPLYCRTRLITSKSVVAALTAYHSKRPGCLTATLTRTQALKSGDGSYRSPCNRGDANLACVLYVLIVVVKISFAYIHNALVGTISVSADGEVYHVPLLRIS